MKTKSRDRREKFRTSCLLQNPQSNRTRLMQISAKVQTSPNMMGLLEKATAFIITTSIIATTENETGSERLGS